MRAFINNNRIINATFAGIRRQIARVVNGIDMLAGLVRFSEDRLSLALQSLLRSGPEREHYYSHSMVRSHKNGSSWQVCWPVAFTVTKQFMLCPIHLDTKRKHFAGLSSQAKTA